MYRPTHSWRRTGFFLMSLALGVLLLAGLTSLLYAQEEDPDNGSTDRPFLFLGPTAAELTADKSVNYLEATPGSVLHFILTIGNDGDTAFSAVYVTDTLPTGLTYVNGSFSGPAAAPPTVVGNVITWSGEVFAQTEVVLEFDAEIAEDAEIGSTLENSMSVSGDGQSLVRTTTTEVVEEAATGPVYLPIVAYHEQKFPPDVSASATIPNAANQWTLNWTLANGDIDYVTGIRIHESQSPSFDTYTTVNLAADARSANFTHPASYNNVYYYRVMALGPWGENGFSNVVTVIGNYYDDFSDPNSGWGVRRMSYLEETFAYYHDGNLVTLVADKWDWVLASPLRPAPAVPYNIQFRATVHDPSNLVSGGAVFGGDWNGDACPEIGNVYRTDNCFNQFYNYNFIFYGPMKLQWEKVNHLDWCPGCDGSPLKRIHDTIIVDPVLSDGPSKEWHTYRIEVRSDGARLYIDGSFKYHFTDTTYINRPYFGTFASTNEYKPAIWLYDEFRVTRVD